MNSSHTEWQHGGGDGYDNRGASRSHGHGYGRSYAHGHGHTHRPGSPYSHSHSHSHGMPQSTSNLKNSENLNASTRHMNKPAPQSYPSYDQNSHSHHRNAHYPPNVNVHSYHPYYGHSHPHFPPPPDHHQRYMHPPSMNPQISHSHSSMHKNPYPSHPHSHSLPHDIPLKKDSTSLPVPESHMTGMDKVHGNNAPTAVSINIAGTRDNESAQSDHLSKNKSQEPTSLCVENKVLQSSIPTSTTGTNNSSSEMPPSSEELPRRVLMFSPAAVSNKEREAQSISHPSSTKHLTHDTTKTSVSSPPSPTTLVKNTHIKPNNHVYSNQGDPRNESYGTTNQYFSHHAPRTRDHTNPSHFDDRHNSYYDPNYQYQTNNFHSSTNQTSSTSDRHPIASKGDDHYPSQGGMQSSRNAFEHYKQQNQHSQGGGAPLTPYWSSATSRKDFDTFHSNSPHFDSFSFDKFTPTPLSTKGNNMKRRDGGNAGFADSHHDQGPKRLSSFDEFHRPEDNYHVSPPIAASKLGESHRTTYDQDGYPNDTISHQRHLSPHNIGRSTSSAVRYCTPIVTGGSRSNHSKTYFGPESSSHGFTPSTSGPGPGPYSSFDDHFDSALGHYHRPYTSSRSGPVSPTRYDNRSPHFKSNPPPDYSTPVIPRGDMAIQHKSEASYYERAYGYENEHYSRFPRPHHPYQLPSGSGFFSPHVPYRRVDGGMLPSPTDVATTNPPKKRRVTPGGSEKPKAKSGASKNQRRQKMYSDYVGVTYNKTHAKFQACITHYRKQYYLGRFKLAVDAARAYDAKARDMKGPGWKINFQTDEDYERAKKKEIEDNETKKKKDLQKSESIDECEEDDDKPVTEDNAEVDEEEENITDKNAAGAKSKLQVTPSPGIQNTIKSILQTKVNEPSLSPYTDRFDASFSPMFSSMLTPSAPTNKGENHNDQTPGTSFLNSVLKIGEDSPNMAVNIFASPLVTETHSRTQIEKRDNMSMDDPSEDKVTKDEDVEESNENKEPKDLDAVSALLMVGGRHQ